MGKLLDNWLAANSERLSAMSGAPPVIPGMAGAPPGFPAAAPQAPVQPAFAQGAGAGTGPSFPAGDVMGPGSPGGGAPQPAFAAQAPAAAPVNVQSPEPTMPKTEAPKPKKKGSGFADLYEEADSESIHKAINMLEQQTGRSVEQLYEQQTGHPPPRNSKKEKIGEFLLEFGLNLMSAPAGEDSISNVGRSAHAALATGRQRDAEYAAGNVAAEDRRTAARERREGRMDKSFDRAATLERLDLERQKVQAELGREAAGKFDSYVGDDGYMYTFNEASGEARRVMVGGKPVKPDPKQNASKQQRFDTEVRYNLYMDVHGKDSEGTPLEGKQLREAREGALKFANREREYTADSARRDALKQATSILSKDSNYLLAEPDEQKELLDSKVKEYTDLLMYGHGPGQGEPDPSKLSEGMATPVTNENGVTEYWTLRDGAPTKVSETELQ